MELVAVGIVKSALNSVIQTANTAITDEIGLVLGVQEELFFIKEELEMMQAFLRVASAEEVKSEIVTTWVKQVQELSYDVEDCLQEAYLHIMKKGCLNYMLSYKAQDQIARQIKVLKVRIEDVSKRNLRYGLIKSSTKNVPLDFMDTPMRSLIPNDKAMIVGQSIPKRKVLELIFEDPDTCKVISIVGMGGCGKTTLVKNVYESPKLRNQFQCFAWITIVHPFTIEKFVINLARELSLLDQDEKTQVKKKWWFDMNDIKERRFNYMEEMKKKINEHMKDKKYAIVLDDLASETEWNKITSIFQNKVKGSRFLVTTRSEELAKSISKDLDIYWLPELSINDLLKLFYRAVYKNFDYTLVKDEKSNRKLKKSKSFSLSNKEGEQPDKHFMLESSFAYSDFHQEITPKQAPVDSLVTEEMETQANKIIKRCGKLPLAIVAIGSFLATRPKTSDEWHKMHAHISSEIHNNPHLGSIMSSLTTSYDGLPYHLKSCFLYLCVFHNHHKIRRSRIIRRWMAEGLIIQSRDMIAEEVGERYFYELMGRSLIQPSETTTIGNDTVTHCSIHDLLYEMIVGKSENENFVSFVGDQSHTSISGKARHVVIQGELEAKNSALGNTKLRYIRSVTEFGKIGTSVAYHKMRLLRVLDLEGTLGLMNRDIRKIGKLRHLKYLGLRGTGITKLPGSLEKLHGLETLDIRDTWVVELPKGVVKLKKLSYLRAGSDRHKRPELYDADEHELSMFMQICICSCMGFLFIFCCLPLIFCCLPLIGVCYYIKTMGALEDVSEQWTNFDLFGLDVSEQWTNFGLIGLKAPSGMKKMRSLHNVGAVDIGKSIDSARELKCLSNLRKITIVGFSNKNGKVLGEAIEELIHLKSLVLAASDIFGLGCCLESINIPPKYLQSLKLFSPIDKLPSWFSSLHNLVKLYFRETRMEMEDVKVIEKLPNLKYLSLLKDSFKAEQLRFGPNTFPTLQVMVLDFIKSYNIRKMSLKVFIETTALQNLANLTIHDRESRILRSELVNRNVIKGSEILFPRWEFEGLENLISLKEVVLDDLNVDVVKSVKGMISRNGKNTDVTCLNVPTKAEESL